MKEFLKKYGHIWIMSYGLVYLPWFLYLERTVVRHYSLIHVGLDDAIPFSEYFVIPYLLWFVYVAGAVLYFFFTSRQEYYRLCTFLFAGMTVCLLICTFYPNGTDLRSAVDPGKNFCSYLVTIIRRADTASNVFPSIHVYNSLGVHFALAKNERFREHPALTRASAVLMVLICLSTMFLKQHSVVDVIGAVILAAVMYTFVYGTEYADEHRPVHRKALS